MPLSRSLLPLLIFAGLLVGGTSMQVVTGVPADLVTALNGVIVVLVVSVEYMRRRARMRTRAAMAAGSDERDVGSGQAGAAGGGPAGTTGIAEKEVPA